MKNIMIAAMIVMATISSVNAQYGNQGYDNNNGYNNSYNDDRYYYDDEFDWHWDVRVRISSGIQTGQITRNESNRLYRQLEDLERKEYAYQSDGIYSTWEQQEVWDDIAYLNRRLGLELYDYDRTFYGFNNWGYDYRGYSRWYYQGGFDFYRFDKRGFGSIRLGYIPRPNYNGWYRNNNNRIGREHYTERSRYSNNNNSRINNPRGNDRRSYSDNNRSSQSNGSDYGRNSRGSSDNSRNSPPNDSRRNSQPSSNDNVRGTQGSNNGNYESRGSRPNNSVEPRSDNFGRGSGVDNSRSERNTPSPSTQESSGRTSRGERSPSIERPNRSVESSPRPQNSGGQSRGGRSENASSGSQKSNSEGRSESRGIRN